MKALGQLRVCKCVRAQRGCRDGAGCCCVKRVLEDAELRHKRSKDNGVVRMRQQRRCVGAAVRDGLCSAFELIVRSTA